MCHSVILQLFSTMDRGSQAPNLFSGLCKRKQNTSEQVLLLCRNRVKMLMPLLLL